MATYVFDVHDAEATAWHAEVAVHAVSAEAAYRLLRTNGGLRKKQIDGGRSRRPLRTEHTFPCGDALTEDHVHRRLDHDGQYSPWEREPLGRLLNWRHR